MSLQRLLRPEPARLDVELRHVPAMPVAAVAASVDHAQVLDWYSGASAELDAAVPTGRGARRAYDNELFTDGRGRALVYLPVAEPSKPSGRVRAMTLPAAELAVTTHRGDHDDHRRHLRTARRLGRRPTLAVAGPVREVYLVGPRDTLDPVGVANGDRLAGLPGRRGDDRLDRPGRSRRH